MSDALDDLRALHPEWEIGAHWITRRSAPDVRQFYAKRDRVEVRAWTEAGLAREIQVSEKSESSRR